MGSEAEVFISELPELQCKTARYLNYLLLQFPGITAKIRFNIPFYYRKSWICYLNPIKNNAIELAFTRANELSNEQGILAMKGRKQVGGITYYSVQDTDADVLEALLLDEHVPYASKRKKH